MSNFETKGLLRSVIGKKVNFSLYRDVNNPAKVYVRHPLDKSSKTSTEIHELRSEGLKNWIYYFKEGNKSLEDIALALGNAVAVSEFDKKIKTIEIAKRVAYHDRKIYLCLHNENHKVIEISSAEWKIIEECAAPVLFIHSDNLKALPVPEKEGGNLRDLQNFINVDESNLSLIIGWILATFNNKIDCPILHIEAPKGSGKTTTTMFLKELIDPDTTGVVAPFGNYRDLCAAAKQIHLLALDNLSGFSKRESNELCRAVTGAGHLNRKLYTDSTLHTSNLHNPFIVNGINFG